MQHLSFICTYVSRIEYVPKLRKSNIHEQHHFETSVIDAGREGSITLFVSKIEVTGRVRKSLETIAK